MRPQKSILLFSFFVLYFAFCGVFFVPKAIAVSPLDLNGNGINDADEAEVVLSSNISLPAGEYFFNNLTITNNATLILLGDPLSSSAFKGVKINAVNLTINFGASISADNKGYGANQGPGASSNDSIGASYGGLSNGAATYSKTYGSATKPTDLGSGGVGYGGGAMRIVVSDTFTNNGIVSSGGNVSSSGGSIYVTAKKIVGSGVLRANGGGLMFGSYYKSPGGGGRVALYYENSSFTGKAEAKGGCGSYDGWSMTCSENGTVGLFDESSNDLYLNNSWRFQKNDSPFNLNNINISNGAKVSSEDGANITAKDIILDKTSTLTLSGGEIINANLVSILGNSNITVIPEKILSLKVSNLNIENGSSISADGKGYINGLGTPDTFYEAGASYGGKGGGAMAKPVYGSDTEPVDFGSGTESRRGGGAIRLVVDNIFKNDGIVSANGNYDRVSGGSIYVNANKISGTGAFQANGGNSSWPYGLIGGAGGRIAIYYKTFDFSGTANALAGTYCYYGCVLAGENGTVVMKPLVTVYTVDCFSNVLFLPGIMGSRLYEQDGSGDKELWVSHNDSNHADLALDNQGKSINSTIHTKDDTKNNGELDETGIVDDVYSFNMYQSFISDLKKWKNDEKIIADYDFIPYDWRLSLGDIITNGASFNGNISYNTFQNFSESFIFKKLEDLQKSSKSGKVTIIAHSNGGLVAKALIQKLKDTNNPLYDKIDKVILIAVPQVGTPDAVINLLHGSEIGPFGFIMRADRSRQLSENMSSVYNLLPSAGYFTMPQVPFVPENLITFENKLFFNLQKSIYGLNISDEVDLKNYILGTEESRIKPSFSDTVHPNNGNNTLYDQAQAVHQILDNWQPSPNTKVIQVAGWGEETTVGLDYKAYVDFSGNEYLSYKPRKVIDGDGVVVVPSALWMSQSPNVERWWVDLNKYNEENIPDRVHRDILEVSDLLDFINSEIKDSTFIDTNNVLVNDTSTLISNKPRLHYTLHSPLTLGIMDTQGRYTGEDPITKEIKQEIPGVNYEKIGDVQFISIPTGISYTLKMQGYQQGSFSLDVEKQEGNSISESTSFQGIPSSSSTIATMNITPDSEVLNTDLKIDQNGDGTIDKTLQATLDGITVYDINPPELQVTFNINTKDVVFSAQDAIDKNPTIIITKTSVTLTDNSGNTTIIPFIKLRENNTKLKFSYNKIIRNGIITIVPNTNIVYDWQEKKGVLTDLDTKITIKNVEKYTFNYKKAIDLTIIKEKIGKNITTTKKQGFVAVTLKTNEDNLDVSY
ncbi:MAG: alpha/beta hydrolase [Patescibacteria group bacterium]